MGSIIPFLIELYLDVHLSVGHFVNVVNNGALWKHLVFQLSIQIAISCTVGPSTAWSLYFLLEFLMNWPLSTLFANGAWTLQIVPYSYLFITLREWEKKSVFAVVLSGTMTTARYRPTWDLALDPLVSCKLCLGEFPLEQMTTITQCQCVFCTLVSTSPFSTFFFYTTTRACRYSWGFKSINITFDDLD